MFCNKITLEIIGLKRMAMAYSERVRATEDQIREKTEKFDREIYWFKVNNNGTSDFIASVILKNNMDPRYINWVYFQYRTHGQLNELIKHYRKVLQDHIQKTAGSEDNIDDSAWVKFLEISIAVFESAEMKHDYALSQRRMYPEHKYYVFDEDNIKEAMDKFAKGDLNERFNDKHFRRYSHGGVNKKTRLGTSEKTFRLKSRSRSRRGRARKTLRSKSRSRSRAARSRSAKSGFRSRKHLLKRVCKELSRSRSRSRSKRAR
jgi:hypothetical protein